MDNHCVHELAVSKYESPDCFSMLRSNDIDIIHTNGRVIRFGIVELQMQNASEPGRLTNRESWLIRVGNRNDDVGSADHDPSFDFVSAGYLEFHGIRFHRTCNLG
jgi:hypothetical protein